MAASIAASASLVRQKPWRYSCKVPSSAGVECGGPLRSG